MQDLLLQACSLGRLLSVLRTCSSFSVFTLVSAFMPTIWALLRSILHKPYCLGGMLCWDFACCATCRNELVPAYVKLLRDTEAEVRVAAASKVSAICKMLPADRVIASIIPCVKDLAADSSQHVRSALASVVMEVAPVLGKSATIEHLLPVFLSLLKDDFPDVRLNIISKLDQVNQVQCCLRRYQHSSAINFFPLWVICVQMLKSNSMLLPFLVMFLLYVCRPLR